MNHNEKPLLALPCPHLVYDSWGYHGCSLMGESVVCQAINFRRMDLASFTLSVPMKLELKGEIAEEKWDVDHAEVKDYVNPSREFAEEFNEDELCPAGYLMEEVGARFNAFAEAHKEDYEDDLLSSLRISMLDILVHIGIRFPSLLGIIQHLKRLL
jgi:hypothetical protein